MNQPFAMRLIMSRMLAMKRQASVRSTTRRLGRNSKPRALSDLRMISRSHLASFRSVLASFSPAHPLSAKIWRSQGKR